jgi:hypothetical protein
MHNEKMRAGNMYLTQPSMSLKPLRNMHTGDDIANFLKTASEIWKMKGESSKSVAGEPPYSLLSEYKILNLAHELDCDCRVEIP